MRSLALAPSPAPSLAKLAVDPSRLAQVPREALPGLLGELAKLGAGLMARLLESQAVKPAPAAEVRLLNVPEVAARLQIAKSFVYELTRTGRLPCVRLGRYVRVDSRTVDALLAGTAKGLDDGLGSTYSPRRDRTRAATHPATAQAHAGRPRRASRRDGEQHRPAGARRDGHTRVSRPVAPATGEAANESTAQAA
jgi:excisionase family DNA binding protein